MMGRHPAIAAIWSVDDSRPELTFVAPPDAAVELIASASSGTVFVARPNGSPVRVAIAAGDRLTGVRVTPGWSTVVLGAPVGVLTEPLTPLEAIIGKEAATLASRLFGDQDPRVLTDFVAARAASSPAGFDVLVGHAARLDGRVALDALARASGLSLCQFRRQWARTTGLSPKRFCRILRFRRALRLARAGLRWSEVAATCGYTDQAHLTKDFREFTGMSPGAYVRCHRAG